MAEGVRRAVRLFVTFAVLVALVTGSVGGVPFADDPNDASGATSGDSDSLGIHDATVDGEGYVDGQEELVSEHPGPAYVWSTEPLTVSATVGGEASDEEYTVCVEAADADGETVSDLGCQTATPTGDDREVEFEIEDWSEYQGESWITIELLDEDGAVTHYETVPVTVIHPDGDLSGDGLTNAEEVRYGTDFTTPDTTGNGLTDWEEVRVHGSDPLVTDTSGDGVGDATAVRLGLDPTIPYLPYVYVGGGLVLVVLVVAGGGALGWHFMRRYAGGAREEPTDDRNSDPSADGSSGANEADLPPSEPMAEPAPEPDGEGPPLTKEEEICQLLREHEGRMKQSQIVDRTEWSQATVSRLVSKLENEGTITKLRSGRENIVELRTPESESVDA